ncbi:Rha family transcriptional regulator [Fusobacterium necrophorum]|uniref:Phage regulatory protein, Rha family n=2 Tax=Fusobacterium necrophorum TaxID=859 RepID=A0AAN4ATT4_9FUSO|nr:Rha family transcriptional regulator [Fusobacterium necrophorum]AYV94708.1 Rha family transcriptional regulator [Fusobacterium necrophorum subsp. funduliforme]EJU18818.1 phage regulatory protein, Rha family [Fusobacterium necrophorum subsp. funduliforme Fnf 1007]KYL02952.1 Rha family transcriptional regulator [Fusobacterium necrophorum subsp. funduliforme]KYM37686.1 Rha family transcriptional regulator [Fusobacterium necrophorum subsp. funduliforme]KYM52197.1 Rha family transcriptional regu
MTYKPELIKKNNVYVVNSRIVAKELGKEHNRVLKDIDKILEKSDLTSLIIPSTYRVPNQRRSYKEYLLTKDCFILYMFNIQGYNDFKIAYIREFNRMENLLKQQTLPLENKVRIEDMTFEQTMRTVKGIMNNLKSRLVHERDILNMQISELDKTGLTDNIYTVKAKGKTYTVQDLGD